MAYTTLKARSPLIAYLPGSSGLDKHLSRHLGPWHPCLSLASLYAIRLCRRLKRLPQSFNNNLFSNFGEEGLISECWTLFRDDKRGPLMFEREESQNRADFCGQLCSIFFATIGQNYRQMGKYIKRTLSLGITFRNLDSVQERELWLEPVQLATREDPPTSTLLTNLDSLFMDPRCTL